MSEDLVVRRREKHENLMSGAALVYCNLYSKALKRCSGVLCLVALDLVVTFVMTMVVNVTSSCVIYSVFAETMESAIAILAVMALWLGVYLLLKSNQKWFSDDELTAMNYWVLLSVLLGVCALVYEVVWGVLVIHGCEYQVWATLILSFTSLGTVCIMLVAIGILITLISGARKQRNILGGAMVNFF